MDEPTIGGQTRTEFCTNVANEVWAQVVATCALEGVPVPAEARPYLGLAAVSAVAVMSRKLNEAGVRYTDQARDSVTAAQRVAVRALFDGPNACGVWLENLLDNDEAGRITDAVMAVLEARHG